MKILGAILSFAVLLAAVPALAQMPPPQVMVQPKQSGAITGGASAAVNPRLDKTTGDAAKDAAAQTANDKAAEGAAAAGAK